MTVFAVISFISYAAKYLLICICRERIIRYVSLLVSFVEGWLKNHVYFMQKMDPLEVKSLSCI